jgi:hypothetical protein
MGDGTTRKREGNVDRKEFLKNVCGLSVCGSVLRLPAAVKSLHAEDAASIDRRLVFSRYQLYNMIPLSYGQ